MKYLITSFLVFILSPSFLLAQSESKTPKFIVKKAIDLDAIDRIVQKKVDEEYFSGVVMVADNGQPIYQKAFGYNYEKAKDPVRLDSRFGIASVTKTFTSIVILQLIEEKKLSLDATLDQLLPQFEIENADQISIHHLLLHISGLPNEKDKVYHQYLAPEQVVETSLKNKKNTFGAFTYNNIDYILLGLIIEKIEQKKWEEVVKSRILIPLKMDETGFLEYGNYPKRFAYTYHVGKNGKLTQDPFFYIENFYAAGAMYATAQDLLKLDQALYRESLLSKGSIKTLSTSYPEYNYTGYSVWNYKYPFIDSKPTIMERRGGILGANVVLIRLTDFNRTIIILSNNDAFNPDSFGDKNNLREAIIRILGQ